MKKFYLIAMCLLLVAFVLCYFYKDDIRKSSPFSITKVQGTEQKELKQRIHALTAAYQSDCEKLLQDFQRDIRNKTNPDFQTARNNIPSVVKKLSEYSVCAKLCYKAAKDKLTGSNDFESAYMSVVYGPIMHPCLHANAVAVNLLENLKLRLQERQTIYASELATICHQAAGFSDQASDIAQVDQMIGSFTQSVQEFQLDKIMASVGVIVEAIFIRETCSILSKVIAKPVAKICGSAGVAGICALADGPLPIGDVIATIIAATGLVWTSYDVYQVTVVMPKHLEKELTKGINNTERKMLKTAFRKAKIMTEAYQKIGENVEHELNQKLERKGEVL